MKVGDFDWDEGNRAKCQKHGVSIAEIEAALHNPIGVQFDHGHSLMELRHQAIGRTGLGRFVFVVFTEREIAGRNMIRPISARFMHKEEVDYYAEVRRQAEEGSSL